MVEVVGELELEDELPEGKLQESRDVESVSMLECLEMVPWLALI